MRRTPVFLFLAMLWAVSGALHAQDRFQIPIPLGLKPLPIAEANALTTEKIELGKQLYFDPRLSRDNTISCASCHDPAQGWSNGQRFATGVRGQVGGRSAPTIINAAYQYFQFWDGRALYLEGQATGPIQNPIEMDLTIPELVEKLKGIAGYRRQFQAVFGGEPTGDNIGQAIAAFERTVLSGGAPYDRFKAGDSDALSPAAQRGMKVFFNTAHCSACHAGPNFTDGAFHNIGMGAHDKDADPGRYAITGLEGDKGGFKTPTLREIARTAPYMHDGRLETLEAVVDYYDKGAEPNPQLDEELFPLNLTAEQKADLVTFLKEGLASDAYPLVAPPELPE